MLTFTGKFNKDYIIEMATPWIPMHLNKNNPLEAEVPFKSHETDKVGYVQFLNAAGSWIFVRIRWE